MCVYISIYGEMYVAMHTYLCNCILTKKNNIFTFISIQKLIQQIYIKSCYWNSGIGATVMKKPRPFKTQTQKQKMKWQ